MEVSIVGYDPAWPERFDRARVVLEPLLAPWLDGSIEHVGSTAVPGLPSKPVVDMLAPVRDHGEAAAAVPVLEQAGWRYWDADPYRGWRHWFLTPTPERRTHHLYLIERRDPEFVALLAWRDLLRADAAEARAYVALKQELAARHPHDRVKYTSGKSAFIAAAFARRGWRPPRPRSYA